jgi:four helix bundle protein
MASYTPINSIAEKSTEPACMSSTSFESLPVWRDVSSFVGSIYAVTNVAAFSQDQALRDDVRRAAIAIMSGFVRAHERGGGKEFARLIDAALASCDAIRAQLYVAESIGYLQRGQALELRLATRALADRIRLLVRSRAERKADGFYPEARHAPAYPAAPTQGRGV